MVRFTLSTIVLATLLTSTFAASDSKESTDSGASNVAECAKSVKVMSQADLDSLRACKILRGAIEITQVPATQLKLEGVEQLIGDLILSGNTDLQTFSAPSLQKVDGQIKIENHIVLSKADFPKLTEAKTLSMSVLPSLKIINFPAGLSSVSNARIEDTIATKVDGFKPEKLDSFTLLTNIYMKSFDFSSVKEVTGEVLVLGNNRGMSFDGAQLESLGKATFFSLSQIDMPSLTNVKSDLEFHENDFTSLKLDKLSKIGGSLTIVNNNMLTETSFQNLNLVTGALSIGNNSQLASIDGFPSLSEVHGTIDLAGSFDSYSMPSLQDVRGGMRLQSTSSELGCSDIQKKYKDSSVVKGTTWGCTANMQESNMVPTVGQKPSSSNGKSGGSSSGNVESGANKVYYSSSSVLALAMGLIYYFV